MPEPAIHLVDTDGDGHADTSVLDDGPDLLLLTDLDGDGRADQLMRIGLDGIGRVVEFYPAHGVGASTGRSVFGSVVDQGQDPGWRLHRTDLGPFDDLGGLADFD